MTRFACNGAEIGVETDNNGVIQRRYVTGPGDDAPIVWYEGAGITDKRYLMSDERGSIVSVTDGAGATLRINSYDDYGIPAPTNLGRFQYTGQAWLPELGLYYYKARMYSPSLGRFMQTDPIGYGDGMNWYNYVGGDPVNGRDASGLASIDYGPCYGGSGCWDSSANDGAGEIVVSYRPSHYVPQEQPGAGFMDMYNPLNSLGLGGAAAAPGAPQGTNPNALPSGSDAESKPCRAIRQQSDNTKSDAPNYLTDNKNWNDQKLLTAYRDEYQDRADSLEWSGTLAAAIGISVTTSVFTATMSAVKAGGVGVVTTFVVYNTNSRLETNKAHVREIDARLMYLQNCRSGS